MRLDEIISNKVGDGVFYDPNQNKIQFKGDNPRLSLRAVRRIKNQRRAAVADKNRKVAQWGLMYGQTTTEGESERDVQKREDHLNKMALRHIQKSLGEASDE